MTDKYDIQRSTRTSRISLLLGLALVIALVAAPFWAGRADVRLIGEMLIYAALASLWNLLAGYTGLVSVGQQLYVGLGGYVLFALALLLGISPLIAIPVAGIVGLVVAVPVSWLLFRLQGAYFAIGTWVAAEVFLLGFAQIPAFGGGSGYSLPISLVTAIAATREAREAIIYWVTCALCFGTLFVIIGLLRSRIGLALTSIRDSEVASESLGVNVGGAKLFVYVVTASLTTMIGALISLQKLRISPEAAFSVNDWTAFVIFMVVIGGIGTIEGPIIGTIIFFLLRETLSQYGTTYLLILGLAAIVIMLRAPSGVWGAFARRSGITLIPVRRRVMSSDGEVLRKA